MMRLQAVITHANFKWLVVARRLEHHRRPKSLYLCNVILQNDSVEAPAEVGGLLDPGGKRVDDVDDIAEGVYVSHMIANCLWMDGAHLLLPVLFHKRACSAASNAIECRRGGILKHTSSPADRGLPATSRQRLQPETEPVDVVCRIGHRGGAEHFPQACTLLSPFIMQRTRFAITAAGQAQHAFRKKLRARSEE